MVLPCRTVCRTYSQFLFIRCIAADAEALDAELAASVKNRLKLHRIGEAIECETIDTLDTHAKIIQKVLECFDFGTSCLVGICHRPLRDRIDANADSRISGSMRLNSKIFWLQIEGSQMNGG